MGATLSRQQRRAMQRHAGEVGRVTDADARFFERHPDRSFRVRRMSRAEIATMEAAADGPIQVPGPGLAPFTVVRSLGAGARMRCFIWGPADEDGSGLTDAQVSKLWHRHLAESPAAADLEASIVGAARQPGGPLHDTEPTEDRR